MVKNIVSMPGEMISQDWMRWVENFLRFTLPLFLGTFFAQLAANAPWKVALSVSLLTLWGAVADFFKKRGEETKYVK